MRVCIFTIILHNTSTIVLRELPEHYDFIVCGTVITEAGVHPNVFGLVYVSALAPDAVETTAQLYDGFQGPSEFVIETQTDGLGFVDLEKFKIGFADDTSDADAVFLRDSQVPINMSVFGTKLQNAAWRTKPSWAVIATDDKAFDQRMLFSMAECVGATIFGVPYSATQFATKWHYPIETGNDNIAVGLAEFVTTSKGDDNNEQQAA